MTFNRRIGPGLPNFLAILILGLAVLPAQGCDEAVEQASSRSQAPAKTDQADTQQGASQVATPDTPSGKKEDPPAPHDEQPTPREPRLMVYLGSGSSGRVDVMELDGKTGVLDSVSVTAASEQNQFKNGSFMAFSADDRNAYLVSENWGGGEMSSVSAFAIDAKDGALKFLGMRSTGSRGAVHVVVDSSRQSLVVANFGGANVRAYKLAKDGSLADAGTAYPVGNSPHAVTLGPDEKTLFVPCMESDGVWQFAFDASSGVLTPHATDVISTPMGSGPRHMAFSADGNFAYLAEERGLTLSVFELQAGSLAGSPLQRISAIPPDAPDFVGARVAEVVVHPNGQFLYLSTRLDGDEAPLDGYVLTYGLDRATGRATYLDAVRVGREPRSFAVDPTGHFLVVANQRSGTDSVMVFGIDQTSGELELLSKTTTPNPQFVGIIALDR